MTLAAISILVAVALGYLAGGRLQNLVGLRVRWPLAAVVGLALQMLPVHGRFEGLVFPSLMVSFGLLAMFAVANLRSPGFVLVVAGVLCNLAVIGLNHGMPVTHGALAAAHQLGSLKELAHGGSRYHLAGRGDVLVPISDSIGATFPLRMVISPGDVAIYAGMIWFLVWGMRRTTRPATAAEAETAPGARALV